MSPMKDCFRIRLYYDPVTIPNSPISIVSENEHFKQRQTEQFHGKNNIAFSSLETISSQRSSNSKILGRQLPPAVETPCSMNGKSSSSLSTPGSKTNIPPLCQSTPKTCKSNIMKFVTRTSQLSNKEALAYTNVQNRSTNQIVKRNAVQSVRTSPSTSRQRYCFLSSGLTFVEVNQLKKLAKTLPDATYQTQFNENVTHIVVKTDNNNGASKTLKYLQGIAHRKWIVSYQWVLDSLKERRAVNEELYEAVDCITFEAGPRKSRLREKGLFEGFVFLCIGPYAHLSVEEYQVSTIVLPVDPPCNVLYLYFFLFSFFCSVIIAVV